jgi:hypothetical protein
MDRTTWVEDNLMGRGMTFKFYVKFELLNFHKIRIKDLEKRLREWVSS